MKNYLAIFLVLINAIAPLTPAIAQVILPNSPLSPNFNSDPKFWSEMYQLAPGDQVVIQVQRYPNLDFRGAISPEGVVVLGLIGPVKLQDLTITQAQKLIFERYNQFIKQPNVSISLLAPRAVQVTVTGEVGRPGFYPLQFPQLPSALVAAGGTTPTADLRSVQVRRTLKDGSVIIQNIDLLTPLQTGMSLPNLRLQDGDTIVVPSQSSSAYNPTERAIASTYSLAAPATPMQVTVIGAVAKPGYYNLLTGSGKLSLALAAAGGSTDVADLRSVKLRRYLADGTQIEESIDLYTPLLNATSIVDLPLKNGDTIFIPQLIPGQEENYDRTLIARSSIAKPKIKVRVLSYAGGLLGTIELVNGSTFLDALNNLPVNTAKLDKIGLYRFDPITKTVSSRTLNAKAALKGDMAQNPLLQDSDVIIVNRNLLAKINYVLTTASQPFKDVLGFILFFQTIKNLTETNTGTTNNK